MPGLSRGSRRGRREGGSGADAGARTRCFRSRASSRVPSWRRPVRARKPVLSVRRWCAIRLPPGRWSATISSRSKKGCSYATRAGAGFRSPVSCRSSCPIICAIPDATRRCSTRARSALPADLVGPIRAAAPRPGPSHADEGAGYKRAEISIKDRVDNRAFFLAGLLVTLQPARPRFHAVSHQAVRRRRPAP